MMGALSRRRFWLGVISVLFFVALPARGDAPLRLEVVGEGLPQALFATAPPGDRERVFAVEKNTGRVRILRDGATVPEPFVDIGARISTQGERGLLGMAFHPEYGSNGYFFLSYTNAGGDSVLSRWEVSAADPDAADADSEVILFTIPQPRSNHNGGMIAFGPDGYLYFGVGDGGGGGDPFANGQNLATPLGAILRIDVDESSAAGPYTVPADNPFVATAGADPRIWAYGLRNPWRFSFDRLTGDLYIADVGQDLVEWVHVQRVDSPGGENYGWPVFEGDLCFDDNPLCASPELFVAPVFVYERDFGRSITGGYVYRGGRIPWLRGTYFYGDFVTSRVASFRFDGAHGPQATNQIEWTAALNTGLSPSLGNITSFGEDGRGELLIADFGNGRVLRVVPDTVPEDVTASGRVDAVDVQFVINAALGLDTGGRRTDIDGDGAVTAVDVQLVINAALRSPVT